MGMNAVPALEMVPTPWMIIQRAIIMFLKQQNHGLELHQDLIAWLVSYVRQRGLSIEDNIYQLSD